MKNRPYLSFSVFTIFILVISACTTPTAVPETPVGQEDIPTEILNRKAQPKESVVV